MAYAYCPHCGVKLPPEGLELPVIPPSTVPVSPFPYYPPGVRGDPFPWDGPFTVSSAELHVAPASQQTVTIDQPQKD